MFGIVLSAFNVVLGFVFRSVIVKFALFFGLFFVTTEFIAILSPLLPKADILNGAFSGITSGVWYFLDLFAFSQGVPLIISAYIFRFIIRRLPIIG
jgi:Protein of unknown function (DUF2523)